MSDAAAGDGPQETCEAVVEELECTLAEEGFSERLTELLVLLGERVEGLRQAAAAGDELQRARLRRIEDRINAFVAAAMTQVDAFRREQTAILALRMGKTSHAGRTKAAGRIIVDA